MFISVFSPKNKKINALKKNLSQSLNKFLKPKSSRAEYKWF